MDWIFNKWIPKSSADWVVVRPAGTTFVNGMAKQFDDRYDEKHFEGILERVSMIQLSLECI